MADSPYRKCLVYGIYVEWEDEERIVDAAVMEGRPLIDIRMVQGSSVHMEVIEGCEVVIEPL